MDAEHDGLGLLRTSLADQSVSRRGFRILSLSEVDAGRRFEDPGRFAGARDVRPQQRGRGPVNAERGGRHRRPRGLRGGMTSHHFEFRRMKKSERVENDEFLEPKGAKCPRNHQTEIQVLQRKPSKRHWQRPYAPLGEALNAHDTDPKRSW